jgi:metal-responsive CopG/Arc/MetJ family transcriptional regulator
MAEKRGGFRLDLRQPLAARLDQFCKTKFRNKTELIRELVQTYLDSQEAEENEAAKQKKK